VVDNWWIDPIKDKENIVYLIAAFSMDVESDDDEKFDEINNHILTLTNKNDDMHKEMKNIGYIVNQISNIVVQKKVELN